ncbi:MAG: HNH endonuclease signature motif containing protein [Actinomycetota bacterium]
MAVAELTDLSDAMDVAVKVDFNACTPRDRRQALAAVARLESQMMALKGAVVDAYDRHHDWSGYGHPSAATGVRETAKMPMHAARQAVSLGRAVRGMPITWAALADGSLTTAHALRLRVAAKRAAFAESEALLVDQAKTLRWRDWLTAIAYWESLADDDESPDPGDPNALDSDEAKARLSVTQGFDGTGHIEGRLGPVGFEAFSEALRRIENDLFADEWRATKEQVGPDAVPADMPRTAGQRSAAALVEMAHRAITAPADGKRPLPLIVIHTDPDTFNRELARLIGVDEPEPLGTTRMHELASGTIVEPTAVSRAALHGDVRRLIYRSPSHVLDYGRAVRLFTGPLRQAIIHAARTCAAEGCEVPASRCEVDHVVEWDDHGVTAAHNAQPLCRADHRHKTKHGPG